MKKRLLNIVAVFCATVLLFLLGYGILSIFRPTKESPVPIKKANELYLASYSHLNGQSDRILSIETTIETKIGAYQFTEESVETLSYDYKDNESVYIESVKDINIGNHQFSLTQLYTDNANYLEINGAHFRSNTDENKSLWFVPSVLIHSELYQTITGVNNGEHYIISFDQATQAEQWALNGKDTFVSATATAWISFSGHLVKSQYEITTTDGETTTSTTYTVSPTIIEVNIGEPEDKETYKEIAYLNGPVELERASGYLLQAKSVSAIYADEIYFEAFGDTRTQSITMHMYDDGEFIAQVDTETHLKNDSRVGLDTTLLKKESFLSGSYQISLDNESPTVNKDVSAKDMQTYCKNLLVGTIILPQHIEDVQVTESDNAIRIIVTANEEFAKSIRANAGQTLYENPDILNDLIQSITEENTQCYLDLDPDTGLPIASGVSFNGKYTITDTACVLRYKIDQTYNLISEIAEQEIKKAADA